MNSTISIETLNVNGLNNLIKRQNYHTRFKKPRSNYMLSAEDTFRFKDTNRLQIRGWKTI